jgi:hypothetical protein
MTGNIRCIGISGKARNGKDTIANYLQAKYGYTVLHFADALYQECRDLPSWTSKLSDPTKIVVFSIPKDDSKLFVSGIQQHVILPRPEFLTDELLKNGMREKHPLLLQWWGTDVRRTHFGDSYWVDKTAAKIVNTLTPIAIPDVRFVNEALLIKDFGGLVVRVIRTQDGVPVIDPNRDPNHPSETNLDNFEFDHVFHNDGSLEDLYAQVREFIMSAKIR